MTIGAIIQARRSSSRFPDKVLKRLPFNSDVTVLQQVIRRVKRSQHIQKIVVATTQNDEDEEIVKIARKENVLWFRGSESNVLERYFRAAKQNQLNTVVRVTSDCPCIDPEVIDTVIESYRRRKVDYASNVLIRTFPHSTDVEVFGIDTLVRVFLEAREPWAKEHVTAYIYRKKPLSFKIHNVRAPRKWQGPDIRLTLDTPQDYALLCAVFDHLYPRNKFFGTQDVVALFTQKPWLKLINADVVQKKPFLSMKEELKAAVNLLKLHGFPRVSIFLKDRLKHIKRGVPHAKIYSLL